jgi:hypothetical protein
VVTRTCAGCGGTEFDARANAIYCSSAYRQRAYRQRSQTVDRNALSGVTARQRRTIARRTVEDMAIRIHSIASGLGDVDPADADSDDTMREYVDSILGDLTVIRRFARKVKAAQQPPKAGP